MPLNLDCNIHKTKSSMYEQSESAICINSTSEKQQKSENNLWDDYEPSKTYKLNTSQKQHVISHAVLCYKHKQ